MLKRFLAIGALASVTGVLASVALAAPPTTP
jgi:hypothetical protein